MQIGKILKETLQCIDVAFATQSYIVWRWIMFVFAKYFIKFKINLFQLVDCPPYTTCNKGSCGFTFKA